MTSSTTDAKTERFTVLAFTDDTPGVLQRLTTVFTRRKVNIDSLTVSRTIHAGVSRFTVVINVTRDIAEKSTAQIRKMVEVREVYLCSDDLLVSKELTLISLETVSADKLTAFETIMNRYECKVLESNGSRVILEKSGSEAETEELLSALSDFRIKEVVRSGRVAVVKVPDRVERIASSDFELVKDVQADEWI